MQVLNAGLGSRSSYEAMHALCVISSIIMSCFSLIFEIIFSKCVEISRCIKFPRFCSELFFTAVNDKKIIYVYLSYILSYSSYHSTKSILSVLEIKISIMKGQKLVVLTQDNNASHLKSNSSWPLRKLLFAEWSHW